MRRSLQILGLVGFVAAAFVGSLVPGALWAALLGANLKTGMAVPWSAPAALALLALGWSVAGGRWPWGSERARAYRRANAMPAAQLGWALAANAFSLTALAGLWILLRHLVKTPGNPADFSAYPLPVVALVLGCAAVVGAVGEEVGLRGYLQQRLERLAPWPVAVLLMALIAAPGHALTQGFVWPTLVFYLLADVTYGVTAYLTNSILPGLAAHAIGLLCFFAFIWPQDHGRQVVSLASAGPGIWALGAQAAVFGSLAVWAFVRLARSQAGRRVSGRGELSAAAV